MVDALIYALTISGQVLIVVVLVMFALSPCIFIGYCFWIAMGGHEEHLWTDDVRRRNLEQAFRSYRRPY